MAVDQGPTQSAVDVRPEPPTPPQTTPPPVQTPTIEEPVNPVVPQTVVPQKRKQTDDVTRPDKKTKQWYDDGEQTTDENGRPVTFIRADKVPGQKRIYGKMSEDQKLAIAKENNEIRKAAQQKLEQEGIYVRFTGTNRPLGITRSGNYYDTPAERLEVVTVGSTVDGPMARRLREQIETGADEQIEPQPSTSTQQPKEKEKPKEKPKFKKLKVNLKGSHISLILYHDAEALKDNPDKGIPKLQIEGYPGNLPGNEQYCANEEQLWSYLNKISWLSAIDRNELYHHILYLQQEDREGL